MKVLLIISDYASSFPFIPDLESELVQEGVKVDVLDVNHHWHKIDGNIISFAPPVIQRLSSVRKIGTLITLLFAKRYLKSLIGKYDAVNIHSCEHLYYYLINDVKKITPNLSVMIWGSDFYRSTNVMREQHRKIFDAVKYVVFANPQNAHDFTSYYNTYVEKSLIAGFGIRKFDAIKALLKKSSTVEAKKYFDLPTDKIVISCGYNGREMQQHLLLLDQIGKLPIERIQKLYIVLQVGYGADPAYLQKIKDKLKTIGLSYKLLDKILSDEEISMLRLAPDITLNAQLSDGFSSSIQEHLLAQNILIVGNWLPYNFLRHKGVFFKSCIPEDFHIEIEDTICNLIDYKEAVKQNTEIIHSISSWQVRIKEWKKIYSNDVFDLQFQKP